MRVEFGKLDIVIVDFSVHDVMDTKPLLIILITVIVCLCATASLHKILTRTKLGSAGN